MARLVPRRSRPARRCQHSRTIGHRSLRRHHRAGHLRTADELYAIAEAMGRTGKGVFEMIPAGTVGKLEGLGGETTSPRTSRARS